MRGREFLRATQRAKGRTGSRTWCLASLSTIPSRPPCPASHRHSHNLVSSSCIAVGHAIGLRTSLFYIFRGGQGLGLGKVHGSKEA